MFHPVRKLGHKQGQIFCEENYENYNWQLSEGNFLRRNLLMKGTQNREGNVKPKKNLGLDWRFGLGYMQETKYGKLLLSWFWSNRHHNKQSYKCHYQWDHQAAGLSRIKFCLHFASFGFKILSRILLGGTLDKVDWTSAIHWIIGQYEIFRNAPDNLYCHNIRISGCASK